MEQIDYIVLHDKMFITLFFIAFVALSILVLLIANYKKLLLEYEHSEEEEEGWKEMAEHCAGEEMGIRDILRTSTFRGFSAV